MKHIFPTFSKSIFSVSRDEDTVCKKLNMKYDNKVYYQQIKIKPYKKKRVILALPLKKSSYFDLWLLT